MYPTSFTNMQNGPTPEINNLPTITVPGPLAPKNVVPLRASFEGVSLLVCCINALRSFTIAMSQAVVGMGLTIIASGGVPVTVSTDNGTQINGANSVTVQPGNPLFISYKSGAWSS